MKALSLTQPYASAVALGYKAVETRSRPTKYRGMLAIHAAKGWPKWAREFASEERAYGRFPDGRLPRGAVVCVVRLIDCIPTEEAELIIDPKRWGLEHRYGDYSPGRWAWMFDPESLEVLAEPVPAKGALGLWEWKLTGRFTGPNPMVPQQRMAL